MYETALLFGGSGFIGSHLAAHLVDRALAKRVVLADLLPPARARAGITYERVDVRAPIPAHLTADLIVNLAAVHREPGHAPHEYFETNIQGAEHVTEHATRVGCTSIVFTSSISVYGPSETEKDERSLPVPTSPYGASKLVAERIHEGWQQREAAHRLVIVRPGVVFGPGEAGNVTRLVKAVSAGYFVFCGNHHVRKAGGYVKDLCESLVWALARDEPAIKFNFTLDPAPRLDELVSTVARVAGKKVPRTSLPYLPILAASHVAQAVTTLAGREQPLHPLRVRKLRSSNNIAAKVLRDRGYRRTFDLRTALEDWKRSSPADWTPGKLLSRTTLLR